MSAWRPYNHTQLPTFHERFEERWGKGTAPFLDPEALEPPTPRAQWINVDTGAAVAVAPMWAADPQERSFGVFYLPPPETSGSCTPAPRPTSNPAPARTRNK